jgi:DNA-binding NarL/FixJ family response regulator
VACTLEADISHLDVPETDESRSREGAPAAPARVFLADDQEEILRTVAQVLEGKCEVVGTARDGVSALRAAPSLAPDVLVLDISMPVMNGIEVASRLRDEGSLIKIVFLTVHEDMDFVDVALSAGAYGYVIKSYLATDLVFAIRRALEGRIFVSHSMHSHMAF